MNADQLQQVESLCEVLYNSADQNARNHAQQQLLSLQSSAEYIPQCQYILDHSGSAYALLLASTSLTKLITTHWNNFSVPQRVDIRNYILSYLASKGNVLSDFVITALVQLVCRITKLGWFDDVQHRELVEEVKKFLQATVDHCIIGLRVLVALVEELNLPTSGRTLPQHRKTAVSFRDVSLLSVFQIALTTLRQLQAGIPGASEDQERKMRQHALGLSASCLGFDFIGTNPDESADDIGTIQVPSSWRNVVQDAETMGLLFDFYKTSRPEAAKLAMQSLILLGAVRRSLFPTDKDRGVFLQRGPLFAYNLPHARAYRECTNKWTRDEPLPFVEEHLGGSDERVMTCTNLDSHQTTVVQISQPSPNKDIFRSLDFIHELIVL